MSKKAMPFRRRITSAALTVFCASMTVAGLSTAGIGTASAAACTDIDISFARGTAEPAGIGIVAGPAFVNSLKGKLAGKTTSTYAVNYPADILQTSGGAGSTDLVKHLQSISSSCPDTKFVIGGYSQGATVIDKALGIPTFTGGIGGTVIPSDIEPKVKAVVAFGNPLGLQGTTIPKASKTYGARAIDLCNGGDPVCGGGINVFAHLLYGTSALPGQAATFAAGQINGVTAAAATSVANLINTGSAS